MIPLTDLQPNRYTSFPIMTMLLIVVNMLALIANSSCWNLTTMAILN